MATLAHGGPKHPPVGETCQQHGGLHAAPKEGPKRVSPETTFDLLAFPVHAHAEEHRAIVRGTRSGVRLPAGRHAAERGAFTVGTQVPGQGSCLNGGHKATRRIWAHSTHVGDQAARPGFTAGMLNESLMHKAHHKNTCLSWSL